MRQVHRAGEKTFIDFSGKRPALIDRQTRGAEAGRAAGRPVLGASGFTYAEAPRPPPPARRGAARSRSRSSTAAFASGSSTNPEWSPTPTSSTAVAALAGARPSRGAPRGRWPASPTSSRPHNRPRWLLAISDAVRAQLENLDRPQRDVERSSGGDVAPPHVWGGTPKLPRGAVVLERLADRGRQGGRSARVTTTTPRSLRLADAHWTLDAALAAAYGWFADISHDVGPRVAGPEPGHGGCLTS